MIKRQTKIIIALVCAIAISIPLYIFVISPLVKDSTGGLKPPPELLPGEVLLSNNEIGMMQVIALKDIEKLIIKNLLEDEDNPDSKTSNEIEITRAKNKKLYVKNYYNAPIYEATLEEICRMLASGSVVSRVAKSVDDYTKYGFYEDKTSETWYSITGGGKTHKVYVGNKVSDGRGYYVRYEGRDALYIQSSYIALYAMLNVYDIMTPILTTPLNESDYLPQSFTIGKKDKLKVDIYLQDASDIIKNGSAMRMRVKYPSSVDVSDFFIEVLYNKFLKSLGGSRVVAVGKGEPGKITALTPEELAEFGIYPNITPELWNTILDAYREVFTPDDDETEEDFVKRIGKMYEGVGVYPLDGECSAYTLSMVCSLNNGGLPNLLFFSEEKDGFYYAYSYNFDLVVQIPASTVDFLEWDATKYQASSIYQTNITNIRRIEITSKDLTTVFDLVHKKDLTEDSTKYFLTYSFTDPKGNFKQYTDGPDPLGHFDDDESKLVSNFRNLFVVFLRIYNQGEIPEKIDVKDKTPYLSVKFYLKLENGQEETKVVNFYEYGTATRLLFQINGVGNAYVKKSKVDLYIQCVEKVLNNIILDYNDYMGYN